MRRCLFSRRSFTYLEAVFVAVVIGILAMITVVRLNPSSLQRADLTSTAHRLASDLRLARSLAITNHQQYRLLLNNPTNSQYRILDAGSQQVGETRTIASAITITGDTTFSFEALGNASSGETVSLSFAPDSYTITVVAATGMITLTRD